MSGPTFVDEIKELARLRNSPSGNPRYGVSFKHGRPATRTRIDADINHRIENSELHGVPVKVTVDAWGLIVNVEPVPNPFSY